MTVSLTNTVGEDHTSCLWEGLAGTVRGQRQACFAGSLQGQCQGTWFAQVWEVPGGTGLLVLKDALLD